ncbi:MAG: hypothetical protein HN389_11375 [Clostridia bacterium]|jgi:hypothetical protein|nr:hypothetical protein [Clostridia bacterium]
MANSKQTNIGWAQIDITPPRPVMIFGQLYERVSQYVKEPLTGTTLVVQNGDEQAIIVSLDVTIPPEQIMPEVSKQLEGIDGLDTSKITVSATHTHNAYDFGSKKLFPHKAILPKEIQASIPTPDNVMTHEQGHAFLTEKIVELIKAAWESRRPGGISSASDYAAVGFNRRPMFRDQNGQDESVMYGAASKENFRRFEDTVDHSAQMLYTWDVDKNLTGVMVNIPCPSQVYELHSFISSDYWHEVRVQLREKLGSIFVLPLCGAAGDQNPLDLVRISKTNEKELALWNAQAGEVNRNIDMKQECVDIGMRISDAVMRGLIKAKDNVGYDIALKHKVTTIEFPIRQVSESEALQAEKQVEEYIKHFLPDKRMQASDMVKMFEPCGIINRWRQQQRSQTVDYTFHVIRIGDTAIATNPFELFVEFGLRIKARAKSSQTMIVQLSDAAGGYLPTEAAVSGGSYSSKPASTLCGPDSGDILCESLLAQIEGLFTK